MGNHTYKEHSINIRKVNTRSKRVTLLNVPPFMDDLEIFHLLSYYGKVEGKIRNDVHKDDLLKGINNCNLHVDVELDEDVSIPSYFWLMGCHMRC